jgi:catechol 2,3-dioxygenase-like lactoylglutathione lyase family enzyme
MPVRIETITMDCRDERKLSAFWTAALGYNVAVDQPGDWMVLRDPSGTGPRIGLQVVPEPELEVEVRRLESLGARRVRHVENDPDESHWVMADPEGNEFCCVRPSWELRPPRPEA